LIFQKITNLVDLSRSKKNCESEGHVSKPGNYGLTFKFQALKNPIKPLIFRNLRKSQVDNMNFFQVCEKEKEKHFRDEVKKNISNALHSKHLSKRFAH